MRLLTYICTLTSPRDVNILSRDGRILEINYPIENLSDGWLKVDTWRHAFPSHISREELPSPEVFEVGDDDEREDDHDIVISEVDVEDVEEEREAIGAAQDEDSRKELSQTPQVEIPTFPERLSMDMFVNTVESFQVNTPESSITSDACDKKMQMEVMEPEVEVERRRVPLGAEIFESLFIGQGGKRRWCVGDVRSGCSGRGKKESRARGRFGDGRKRWCWNW
jgi:hypothetical protein